MNKEIVEKKFHFFVRYSIFILIGIFIISIFIRLFYLEVDTLLSLDALFYFWYGIDLSILNEFPRIHEGGNIVYNNGWPTFLGIFFSILDSEKILDYMLMQKTLSILISSITIFPMYFLCRRFFDKSYSILGSSIFVLEPRIIQNSLFGITEPLYILLTVISLSLILTKDKKMNYLSFAVIGLATIVRSEAIFLLFAFSIIFFIKYRKEGKEIIPKYMICILIFILLILPMSVIKLDTMGTDGIFSRLTAEAANLNIKIENQGTSNAPKFIFDAFFTLGKFIGWTAIPIFIIFVPFGIYRIFKDNLFEKWTIIITYITLLVPVLYAYSIPALDTRYLFIVYSIYCVISILSIKFFVEKFKLNKNITILVILVGITLTSIVFLEIKIDKEEKNIEIAKISDEMYEILRDSVIFRYGDDTKYLKETGFLKLETFPVLEQQYNEYVPRIIGVSGIVFENMDEYIEYGKIFGLTHVVLNGQEENPSAFNKVFNNESEYPYLEKIFDSRDNEYQYQIKIFKIDFKKFDER